MSVAWRIILILAAIILTAVYWGVAWIHFFVLTFCHGDARFCGPTRAQRMADMTDAAVAYAIGYVLIVAAIWVFVRWRRSRSSQK